MNLIDDLSKEKVVIVSHVYATGPSHSLEDYLKAKVEKLFFVGHPFVFSGDPRSHFRLYSRSKNKKEVYSSIVLKNQLVSIVKDTILTFFWILKQGKFDLYVGVDGTNAFVGIILKRIGCVKKVVYYTIDYVPDRFPSPVLNSFYHFFDTFAVKHADIVWNLSSIMVSEREKRGLSQEYRTKQIVVPVGTEDSVQAVPFSQIHRFTVGHIGHLIEKQGVQLFIRAIPLIIKKIPKFHTEIIGGGGYEHVLRNLVKELKISKYVTFHGFIKDHTEAESLLSYCACGIAPYVDSKDNFVRYTDPGKVKAYLAVGLPIVITSVPEIATLLDQKECGFAVKDTSEDIAAAVIRLLESDTLLKKYRTNAQKLSLSYRWDKIFAKALSVSI